MMNSYLQRAKSKFDELDLDKRKEFRALIKKFIRLYEFLSVATCLEDIELHKKYTFINYLESYLKIDEAGPGFSLTGKIKASGFQSKKSKEIHKSKITPDPVVRLPIADEINITESNEKKLSEIIEEINARTGKSFDVAVAKRIAIQIRDSMKNNEELRNSALNNSAKDFEFSYFDHVDDALIEAREQDKDFSSLLLKNDEMKKQILGFFTEEIYNNLREYASHDALNRTFPIK